MTGWDSHIKAVLALLDWHLTHFILYCFCWCVWVLLLRIGLCLCSKLSCLFSQASPGCSNRQVSWLSDASILPCKAVICLSTLTVHGWALASIWSVICMALWLHWAVDQCCGKGTAMGGREGSFSLHWFRAHVSYREILRWVRKPDESCF